MRTIDKGWRSKLQLSTSLWWPIYIINSVDKTKLSCITPHWCSTTVSLVSFTFSYIVCNKAESLTWTTNKILKVYDIFFLLSLFNPFSPNSDQKTELLRQMRITFDIDWKLVQLLAFLFSQLRTQNEIIVMELCSGGSLFTMLENPSNAYGFQEDEFKQVVKDVGKCKGWQILRVHTRRIYI